MFSQYDLVASRSKVYSYIYPFIELALSNPDSMKGLKEIMWSGTDHWDELLMERAEISGKRVLSDFTRQTIEKLKKG